MASPESQTEQDPLDPLDPTNISPAELFKARRGAATAKALGSLNDDPEQAAESTRLSEATGTPAEVIFNDFENQQQQHKAAIVTGILDRNEHLRDYALNHPLGTAISRDDWGALDEYTQALGRIAPRQKFGAIPAVHAAIKEAWSEAQIPDKLAPPDFIANNRLLANLWDAANLPGGPLFAWRIGLHGIPNLFSAGLAGLKGGGEEYLTQIGVPKDQAAAIAKQITAMVEYKMQQPEWHAELGRSPEEIAKGVETINKSRPWIEAGEMPPVGTDSIIDEAHKLQAKLDAKNGKEVSSKAHATATIDTPEAFEALTRRVVGDAKIGISSEGLSALYGDEVPTAGDNKLGDLASVRDQYEWALRNGKDVQVPLAEWLARVDQDTKKELEDHIRWRPEGMTLEETKKPVEPEAEQVPTPLGNLDMDRVSGIVSRVAGKIEPALPPQGVIPPASLMSATPTSLRGMNVTPVATFSLRDGLGLVKTDNLNDFQKFLTEMFSKTLMERVGDVPVHAISDLDFDRIAQKVFGDKGYAGLYDTKTNQIMVRQKFLSGQLGHDYAVRMLLHEGSHALTLNFLRGDPNTAEIFNVMMNETKDALERVAKEALDDHYIQYYLSHHEEFVAGAYENRIFREYLSAIPASKELKEAIGLTEKTGSIWDAFRQLISDVFYWATGVRFEGSMLDAFLKAQEQFELPTKTGDDTIRGAKQLEFPEMTRMEDRPLFERARQLGLSGKRYEAWVKAINSRAEEKAKFQKDQQLKEEQLRQTKEWKATYKDRRKVVEYEISSRPDFASDRFLREGGEIGGQHVRKQRLDSKLIPEEYRGKLPEEYVGDRGLNPDHVASIFGFNSGRSLLESLARLNDERKLNDLTPEAHLRATVDAETDRWVRRELGDSHAQILRDIEEHVYSPSTIDMVSEEMLHLAEKHGAQLPISGAKAKSWVQEQFNAGKMGTHSFKDYQSAAQRAEQRITDALLAGKETEAFEEYQRKMINMLAANEAKKLEKQQASADKLFKRMRSRIVEGLPEEFTNFIQQVMGRGGFEFGPGGIRRTLNDLNSRIAAHPWPNLDSFTTYVSKRLEVPIMVPDWLYGNEIIPQEHMTVDQWREWSGFIKSLYKIGREEKVFNNGRDKEAVDDFVQRATNQVNEFWHSDRKKLKNPTRLQQLPGIVQGQAYRLIWLESVWNRFDLGNPYGLFNKAFSYPASEAMNQYSVWVKQFSKELDALERSHVADRTILPQIFKDRNGKFIEDLNHDNLRQALLYAGSESGYQKLIRGWMLADIPKAQQDAAFPMAAQRFEQWIHENATKEDWEYVAKVWDVNKRIFDLYEKMVQNLGVVPARRVALRPMTDAFGRSYEGGYSKLIYDEDEYQASSKATGATMFDAEDPIANSIYQGASTPKSHEKERTGYVGPLYLKTNFNSHAMSNVLRDAAIRPFLVNTSKIWNHPEFKAMLREAGFKHVEDMLEPYLKAMGGMGERVEASARWTDRMINAFSRNTVSRLIGWNLSTAQKHGLSAAVNSIAEVGPKNWVREHSMMRTSTDLSETFPSMARNQELTNKEFAMKVSQELQRRTQSILETLGGQIERLAGARTSYQRVGDWFQEKGPMIVAWADLESAIPTWIAEFKNSISEQAQKFGNVDNDLAVEVANRAVRRAHGSTSMATRPSAMRGNAMAQTFMRLFSFWNTLFQRNYEAMWRTKYAAEQFEQKHYEEGLKQIPAVAWLMVSANIAPAVIEYLIDPYPMNDKDSTPIKVLKMGALASSSMIPFVREAVHAWVSGYPTTLGVLDTGLKDISQAVHDIASGAKMLDAEHGGKTIKTLNSVFATFSRISNDEVGKLAKTIWDVTHRSKETPRTPYEYYLDAKTGHPREMHR